MSKRKPLHFSILLFCALLVWFPLYMLIFGAFMDTQELTAHVGMVLGSDAGFASWPLMPRWPTLQTLTELLIHMPGFYSMFWNTCFIAFPSAFGQLLIASLAAWALVQGKFKGRNILYLFYLVLMLMPFQVLMVPSYMSLDALGLLDTRWSIILPALFSAFPIFILYHTFSAIPAAFVQAAQLDGASHLQVFALIGIPLGKSGILAALVLGFLESWNALEQPLIFSRDMSQWPIALLLSKLFTEDAGIAFAASLITTIPALLIFLWGKPYIQSSIHAGALKE